ncbi:MAG: hypothetical protein ACLGI6_09910 [Gammaproteobacteria bacterium]
MDRKIRIKAVNMFGLEMGKFFPEFRPVKIKSMYLGPGTSVWQKDSTDCSYFVMFCPEPKGQQDLVTVELGWSRLKRFPELMQIPSIAFPKDVPSAHKREEGIVRIGTLCDAEFGWVPVKDETIASVVEFLIEKLQRIGIPFLNGLANQRLSES